MACAYCNNSICTCTSSGDKYRSVGSGIAKYKLQSPIPEEVRDITRVQSWFKKQKYIPFAGTTNDSNHTYLRYLVNLTRFSPTLSSCINGIRFYAFAGKPNIIKSTDSEFDFSNDATLNGEDLSLDKKNDFTRKLALIDKGNISWNQLAINLYNSYKSTGNAYLSVKIKKVLDTVKIYFKFIDPEHCLYKVPDLFVSHKIDVSESWDNQYLKHNPPETFSVYPFYDESEKEIRTIIHLKNGTGHYGRPDWFAAAHDAFLEVKNKEYLLNAVHNNFTGQVLIEVEGEQSRPILNDKEARENGWRNDAARWQGNFTNGGDAPDKQSVIIMERPAGSSAAFVHEFQVQTKEDFFIKIGEHVERNIIKVNQWSRNLSGADNPSGFTTDAFISELKSKLPVIEFYQNKIDNEIINTALDFVGQQLGDIDYADNNIRHKSPFETILKNLNPQANENNNNTI